MRQVVSEKRATIKAGPICGGPGRVATRLPHHRGEWRGEPRQKRSARELLVFHPLRLHRIRPQTADLVLFIGFEVALEPFDMGITFKGQDMRAQTVQEEAVVADDHRAAGEIFQRGLECLQGFHVQIVGRLVQQQHIAAPAQQLGHVDTVALTARQQADLLLLVAPLEVERPAIGAAVHRGIAQFQHLEPVRDFLPHGLVGVQRIA